jgi:hypothetical protein
MSILIHIKNEKYNSKIIHEQFGINQIYSVLENLDFRFTNTFFSKTLNMLRTQTLH